MYYSYGQRPSPSVDRWYMIGMIYFDHITGDEYGPNFLTFVLRLRENPEKKTSTRKLTRPGIEPGSAAWELTMLSLDHSVVPLNLWLAEHKGQTPSPRMETEITDLPGIEPKPPSLKADILPVTPRRRIYYVRRLNYFFHLLGYTCALDDLLLKIIWT